MSRGRPIGGARAAQECRRRLPEDRAADRKTDRGGAGRGRREPAPDGGEVGGLSENDLAARRVRGNRRVDRARAFRRQRAFDLPEFGREAAAIRLGDEAGKHRGPADRLELRPRVRRAAPPGSPRTSGLPAPRHQVCSASSFSHCPSRIAWFVVRSIPDEHFDEGAGQRARERFGRPRERERARLLRGRADVDARFERVGQHRRTRTARRSAARRTRVPRPSGPSRAGTRRTPAA